ncbi:MAG: biotin/lipoyl-binding protein [Coriobacteriales bacterium]|jgi:multidrug efflux pump subunit AcrA (membrane-fusion protein)|nr:biotin/lipoyl-binding protein [Coriobacteriales bacterium]
MADKNSPVNYVLKHAARKERSLKYDFMPPLLDIIERPAHRAGTVIITTIFFLIAAAVIWANLARLDVIVQVRAQTVTSDDTVVLQAPAAGILKEVGVVTGDYVQQGTTLFVLDTSLLDKEAQWSGETTEILEAQRDVLTRIYEGTDPESIDSAHYAQGAHVYLQSIIENERLFADQLAQLVRQRDAAASELDTAKALFASVQEAGGVGLAYQQQEQSVKQNE